MQYCTVIMTLLGLANALVSDWYCLKLITSRTRIKAICIATESLELGSDQEILCSYRSLLLAVAVTSVSGSLSLPETRVLTFRKSSSH